MNRQMAELHRAARAELGAVGELGGPLVSALDLIANVAGERGTGVLADPSFALEVLDVAGAGTSPTVIGRVLDHLRTRAGLAVDGALRLTVVDAAAAWEAEAFALRAPSTASTYRAWVLRLVAVHGDAPVADISSVDLANLIATWTRGNGAARGRQRGLGSEETAVSAFRHFWAYLLDKGVVARNPARSLRKPQRPEPQRRPIRVDEAALMRQFARMGSDALLDETALCLVERLGLRPVELDRLRLCDVDLVAGAMRLWGKGDRHRRLPLPPRLAAVVARYVEDRRPPELSAPEFAALPVAFLRRRPSRTEPEGSAVGRVWLDRLFPRLLGGAPQLNPDLSVTDRA